MPSPRYTVRLPAPLDEAVQRHLAASGTPFAVLMREALSAYLADRVPTGALTAADRPADTLQALQIHLVALTERVEILEATLARLHQLADSPTHRIAAMVAAYADSEPTRADSAAARAPTGADRVADIPPTPADTPRRKNALPLDTLREIAAARQQHPALSHRAFAALLFDSGLYRSTGRDGTATPASTSLVHRWLKEAQNMGLL